MKIVNISEMPEETWTSPDGRHVFVGREISEALGRVPESSEAQDRHPFDVELQRIPPGAPATIFHSHSAQWEFYQIVSGGGTVRHATGSVAIGAGDAFVFKPGEAHQIVAGGDGLVMYVIADNPIGDQRTAHEALAAI